LSIGVFYSTEVHVGLTHRDISYLYGLAPSAFLDVIFHIWEWNCTVRYNFHVMGSLTFGWLSKNQINNLSIWKGKLR